MVDSVATIALETLRDLLIEEVRFLGGVSSEVEEVRRQLKTMHAFLKDADRRQDKYNSEVVRNWVAELRDLSIQAENALESYAIEVTSKREAKNFKNTLKRFTCILSECLSVHQTGKEIKIIKSRMSDLTKQLESMSIEENSSISVNDTDWSRKTYGNEVEQHFVGMKEDIEKLVSLLTSDDISNRVISICGMGGLGKTTLANRIYKGEAVQWCFKNRAWICVSQQCQPKIVFQQLLKQLLPDESEEQDEDEMVRKLYDVQKTKKCLVVLDDVWEVDHWNCLKRAIPIAEADCKVLITTRNHNIASTGYIHKLECLKEDEGFELLQKIALPITISQELTTIDLKLLEEIGREIAKKCGCLPLPISIIGGILRQEKTSTEWMKVYKNIDSYLQYGKGMTQDKRVAQILDLSYNMLPYNLKSCFLYLGCFREDQEIYAEKLYLLWLAEGMISLEDKGRGETLRDVAERYLFELANRCMVQVEIDEDSIYSRFESCRLHDLIRGLCLSKGKEEGFLEVMDRQMGREEESSICKTSRLAIHLDELDNDHNYNIGKNKNIRSLLFLQKGWPITVNWYNCITFGIFRFLKVLVLEGYEFENGKLPKGIEKLNLLKLLSLKDSVVKELSPSICKLPCLQTLSLEVTNSIRLPNFIYKMRYLRHLFLEGHESVGGGKLKLEGLNELETITGFDSSVDDIAHLLKLRKLQILNGRICDEESLSMIVDHILNHHDQFRNIEISISNDVNMDSEEGATLLKRLVMCHSLSILIIECGVGKLPAYEARLYQNVTWLFLENTKIEENPMEILEKLPTLRSLYLWIDAYVGREMVCGATGFPQLRELKVKGLPNLVEWRVEKRAMPNLSSLGIFVCNKLEMIPQGLKFITTLKVLILDAMPVEFMKRVRGVDGEEGEDYHNIKHIPTIEIY